MMALLSFDVQAASSCDLSFELSTQSNQVVDQCGKPFKLKGVNWFGAHESPEVAGGLDKQPLSHIIHLIKSAGFNSVRLTFSNHMLHNPEPVDPHRVAANPDLQGKTPLQIFDIVVKALTDAGIVVILNNHTTTSEWCCGFDFNGLWHHPLYQTTSQWLNDWVMMVSRYRQNPLVAGVDLRNEVRTMRYYGSVLPVYPNWGLGDENDWKLAATQAANIILAVNSKLLIIIEGINWYGTPMIDGYRPMLMPVRSNPVQLTIPHKLVYEAHVYAYTGPKHTGNDASSIGQVRYGDMDENTLRQTLDEEFGYVLEAGHPYTAPVWLGEFGVGDMDASDSDKQWFKRMTSYLLEKNMGWSFWALNPIRADGSIEPFGLLTMDWSDYKQSWRDEYMQQLLRG